MQINVLFIVLTFVICVAVILLADSMTNAMLMISILANFLIISSHFGKINKMSLKSAIPGLFGPACHNNVDGVVESDQSDLSDQTDQPTAQPGQAAKDEHDSYRTGYMGYSAAPTTIFTPSEKNYTIDNANIQMAQRRSRDKKCTDGWVTKNANYFKYHYAGEFEESENKPWWGRSEY